MARPYFNSTDWRPIETAPADVDVTLLVSDGVGSPYRLPFQCKLTSDGWVNSKTGSRLTVEPTNWYGRAIVPPRKPHVPRDKGNDLT